MLIRAGRTNRRTLSFDPASWPVQARSLLALPLSALVSPLRNPVLGSGRRSTQLWHLASPLLYMTPISLQILRNSPAPRADPARLLVLQPTPLLTTRQQPDPRLPSLHCSGPVRDGRRRRGRNVHRKSTEKKISMHGFGLSKIAGQSGTLLVHV